MIRTFLILVILKNYEYLNDLQSAVSLQSQTNTITYPSVAQCHFNFDATLSRRFLHVVSRLAKAYQNKSN